MKFLLAAGFLSSITASVASIYSIAEIKCPYGHQQVRLQCGEFFRSHGYLFDYGYRPDRDYFSVTSFNKTCQQLQDQIVKTPGCEGNCDPSTFECEEK